MNPAKDAPKTAYSTKDLATAIVHHARSGLRELKPFEDSVAYAVKSIEEQYPRVWIQFYQKCLDIAFEAREYVPQWWCDNCSIVYPPPRNCTTINCPECGQGIMRPTSPKERELQKKLREQELQYYDSLADLIEQNDSLQRRLNGERFKREMFQEALALRPQQPEPAWRRFLKRFSR